MRTFPSLSLPIDNPRLRPYLELLRLPATFAVWSSILAAHLIATGANPQWGLLLLHLIVATALFWSGSALNDCFDRERDASTYPDRPIPSGRVQIRTAWALGFGLMALGLALAAVAGGTTLRTAAALAVGILAYDALPKGGLLSPLVMGACRYMTWMLGLSVASSTAGLSALTLPVLLYSIAATVLHHAATDPADRLRTGIFVALLGLMAVVLGGLALSGRLAEPLALVPLLFALYPLIRALRRMRGEGGAEAARWLAELMLPGAIALDAVLLFGTGHPILAVALLGLLIPTRILRSRLG